MSARRLPGVLLLALGLLTALPASAPAYLTALSLTTDTPSRVARYAPEKPRTPLTYPIEFPGGATDTHLIGLAFRPQSEDLYALGSGGTLYVLQEPSDFSGPPFKAVQVNPTPAVSPVEGSAFGFAFNPVKDAVGVVDDAGQNLLFSPFNGSLLNSDGTLAYAPGDPNAGVAPVPVAAAFSNSLPAAQKTTMYVIDSASDSLAIQGPSDSAEAGTGGVLHTVGKLGLDVGPVGGFDFARGAAGVQEIFALLNPAAGGAERICRVSLQDVYDGKFHVLVEAAGQANCLAERTIEGGGQYEGLAVVPPSVVSFADASFEQIEGQRYSSVQVVRHGGLRRPATVTYKALRGLTDKVFKRVSGSVSFEAGQERAAIAIPIRNDKVFQPERELALALSPTGPDTVRGDTWVARVTVADDELNPRHEPRLGRPTMRLGRVLQSGRLIVPYRCRAVCNAFMMLALGDDWISVSKAGPKAGRRSVVFELDAEALRAIRRHLVHGSVSLGVESEFEVDSFLIEKTLHFRLRR